MADNNSSQSNQGSSSSQSNSGSSDPGTRYFRTTIAGLSVVIGDPKKGEVAPEMVRFSTFEERVRGDKVYVGYLETDNMVAIKKLVKDGNVEEIKASEFKESTDVEKGAKPAVV